MTTQEKNQKNLKAEVSIKDLLESGAHFGHQRHRWNPKMRRFIFEERNGIYIIDLAKTIQQIRNAQAIIKEIVSNKGRILFLGTKKQAKAVIRDCAEACGEFFVCERWLGGMLTNLTTIRQSVKTLERIEKRIASASSGTKKEGVELAKRQVKLDKNLAGIRGMRKQPSLVIVIDPSKEHIAVAEARKLGVPVMALVDTNCNPDPIDHIIACNDDALKSIKLILQALTASIVSQKKEMNIPVGKDSVEEKSGKVAKPAIKKDDKEEKKD